MSNRDFHLKKYLLLLLLFTSVFYGQETFPLDSLKNVIHQEKLHDSIICSSYSKIIKHFKRINEDSCRAYVNKLKSYAATSKSNLAYFYYHKTKAGYYGIFMEQGDNPYDFINSNLLSALEFAKKQDEPKWVCLSYSRLSEENSRQGYFKEALQYSKTAIECSLKHQLWEGAAYDYSMLGEIYRLGYNMKEESLQSLLKSDSIYKSHGNKGELRAYTFSALGDIYKEMGKLEEAEKYQQQAFDLYKINGNEYQEKNVLGALASIERQKKNYKKAIAYFEECISYYRDNKYLIKEAMYHIGLSDVYFESNQIPKSLEIIDKAIYLSRKNDDDFGVLLSLINKAKILHKNESYQDSYNNAFEAKKIADEMDSYIDKRDALEFLYKSSEKLNKYEEAYHYSVEYKSVSDTLLKRESLQKAKELEAKYKVSQQEQEIITLQTKNDLVEEQKKRQRNLLVAGISVALLGLLLFLFLYRNRQKTNKKLIELDTAKSTFFENISHEVRTPLSLIIAPVEKRLRKNDLKNEDRKELEMIHRNSNRLMELVNQLLDISKLKSKHFNLKVSKGNLSNLLKSITASFDFIAKDNKINYQVTIPSLNEVWFDRDAVEKIVTNLLSNAFKYSAERGTIGFTVIPNDSFVDIVVENDGTNFEQEELDTIFERFYQSKNQKGDSKNSTGIGLSLVKDLVRLSHGQIKAENTSNSSVKFTVTLPITRSAFSSNEILEIDESKTIEEVSFSTEPEDINDVPILLIVEDNNDIREFIKESFQDNYKVLEATQGAEGIEMAIEYIPDIIISDIMMPITNGIELCEKLKKDERTSHIPIVLLTAKIDEADQYRGLEMGADDYILKPFSLKLLETRIQNLVASRLQLRDRYSKEVILKPKDISVNSFDERFIEKVNEVLDDKITEDSFSIEEFSKCLHMSRMQLHRKIKALTGLSASEFLRTERLKLAAALLKDKDININEVCYKVGFNNPSYFAKCFKETYSYSPSEYRDL